MTQEHEFPEGAELCLRCGQSRLARTEQCHYNVARSSKAYEHHARRVAAKIGLTVRIQPPGGDADKCPAWGHEKGCNHGRHYRITLKRAGGSLTFDFWGSIADDREGRDPRWYDVLACLSSDASLPTDPDEVADELGPMKPSQAIEVARFARRLQAFFTQAELEALQEIQ